MSEGFRAYHRAQESAEYQVGRVVINFHSSERHHIFAWNPNIDSRLTAQEQSALLEQAQHAITEHIFRINEYAFSQQSAKAKRVERFVEALGRPRETEGEHDV